jgi:hypothetical protein
MSERRFSPSRRSLLLCVSAAITALLCGALLTAAALVPAPATVVPMIVAVCIGCPMAAVWNLSDAVADVRDRGRAARNARAARRLRRQLAALPERDHPLGL